MKRKLTTYLLALLLPALTAGCLYDEVLTTADGEEGTDPTEVTLKANLSLNFKLPALSQSGTALERPLADESPEYRHRFVVEAYLNHQPVARQVVYEDIVDGRTEMTLPVSMKLHARNYEIAVWKDYVQTPDEEQEIAGTEEYFWDTSTSSRLYTVLGSDSYRANNEYKDAFCGSTEIDLGEYRDEWGAVHTEALELTRPVARYELVADDVEKFLSRVESGEVKGESFTVRVKYNDYLRMGYNVPLRLPRHGLMYMQYEKTLRLKDLQKQQSFPLVFDYVLAADDGTSIPLTIEIVDSSKQTVASTTFAVGVQAGRHTVITHSFLTADPDGGIDFDPDYDDEVDIDVPGIIS